MYMGGLHARDGCQQRAHHPRLFRLVVGLARDLGLWATRGLHRRTGRAGSGLWALDHGAADHGAWRALTDLARLVARADARRAGRYRGLQDVLGHIRRCRALTLEHVPAHVGQCGARRDGCLQNILGPVHLGALATLVGIPAVATAVATIATRTCTVITSTFAHFAGALGYIDEPLNRPTPPKHGTKNESHDQETQIRNHFLQG